MTPKEREEKIEKLQAKRRRLTRQHLEAAVERAKFPGSSEEYLILEERCEKLYKEEEKLRREIEKLREDAPANKG